MFNRHFHYSLISIFNTNLFLIKNQLGVEVAYKNELKHININYK